MTDRAIPSSYKRHSHLLLSLGLAVILLLNLSIASELGILTGDLEWLAQVGAFAIFAYGFQPYWTYALLVAEEKVGGFASRRGWT